jgi:hypothetical protein
MGIILDAEEFSNLKHWTPVFQERLRAWGLDSPEAIGSVVFTSTDDDVAKLVRAYPDSDFMLPEGYRSAVLSAASANHDLVTVSPERFLLLSRTALAAPPHEWSCRM